MLLNRSLGSGGVGYSILLKGTGSCISAFMYVSKTTNSRALPGKKKTQNHKRGECFSCQKNVWLNSSQETADGQPGLAWSAAAQIDIHLKKVFERCLEVMVSSELHWRFNCPSRCSERSKICRGSRTSGGEWWRGMETCQRQIKFPRLCSGVVAWHGSN